MFKAQQFEQVKDLKYDRVYIYIYIGVGVVGCQHPINLFLP